MPAEMLQSHDMHNMQRLIAHPKDELIWSAWHAAECFICIYWYLCSQSIHC